MSETAIRVTNITKEYTIDYSHTGSFKELVMRKLFHCRQQPIESRTNILALDNLSFEVKKGEALGIIGKNGAGKSTLLKVLSGITRPTSGEIEIYGRMSSILDIGVGFNPELTGRENIYLSGELNGLTRKEIRKRLDEIIEFSGVEKFIDTPVKYYSSGMFLRLAFSVFTGIDSEILLLDEVMSVGDAEFQLKSSRKLQSMFGQGKTIVLVSHNPADVVKLCSMVMILEDGKIKEEGMPGKVVVDYMEESIMEAMEASSVKPEIEENKPGKIVEPKLHEQQKLRSVVQWDDIATAPGNEYFRLIKVQIRAESKLPGEIMYINEKLIIEITYWKENDTNIIDVGFTMKQFHNLIFGTNTALSLKSHDRSGKGFFMARSTIPSNLLNNSIYSIDIHALSDKIKVIVNEFDIISFMLHEIEDPFITTIKDIFPIIPGSIRPNLKWEVHNI